MGSVLSKPSAIFRILFPLPLYEFSSYPIIYMENYGIFICFRHFVSTLFAVGVRLLPGYTIEWVTVMCWMNFTVCQMPGFQMADHQEFSQASGFFLKRVLDLIFVLYEGLLSWRAFPPLVILLNQSKRVVLPKKAK